MLSSHSPGQLTVPSGRRRLVRSARSGRWELSGKLPSCQCSSRSWPWFAPGWRRSALLVYLEFWLKVLVSKGYLLPFRKPKRVRTAFSPSQLLKLEHAFENNHYVVGAERKSLAQSLSLTETQVKVWFQNRRTKHKRMQQEEDAKSNGGSGEGGRDGRHSPGYEEDDEDELIDMEMDDECGSDEDEQEHG